MVRITVYLDEDVAFSFYRALSNRGVDVITTQEANNKGTSDIEQLNYAIKSKRVIFSHNKRDFALLHKDILEQNGKHCGIIISDQIPAGDLLRRFMKLWFTLSAETMVNRIEFLSTWK
ncbi:hypothetical protein A2Y85_02980 [candidate division WOR-3 bacterium RBG_13_43_14]|uniref:DUF5615 domain-containing protein n=1 Tax=candidate division WOR-3 bacterium RBG_13_43_14 TaxID=1802590 RepID=A0A1F4UDI6_UNCW3|nr:MAG: hypothetical protein A2Y85_02980 [candidate division WOR-3 bacterium RBG_13_43_14]